MSIPGWLPARWPAPSNVRAGISLRHFAGRSEGPYASANIGLHVGDDPARVLENRARLRQMLGLPSEPVWLQQVHGDRVLRVDAWAPAQPGADLLGPVADAAVTSAPNVVLAIQTADCLPILLCDASGQELAAIHAGWRGLAAGVIARAVESMAATTSGLHAWIGPGIGPQAFEVGDEVRVAMLDAAPSETTDAIARLFQARTDRAGKWWCDLPQIAAAHLRALGVTSIHLEPACTYHDADRFFSHRRDRVSGRMVSLIWRYR